MAGVEVDVQRNGLTTATTDPQVDEESGAKYGKVKSMELTVHIPDDIAERLGDGVNDDLSRRALEALLAEEYRLGHLNKPDLRRLLGFETGYEIDGFLKAHNVYEDYAMEDFEREREALKSLGF